MSNIPQEILVEIFERLPTKSVGQCRCLSKGWNTQLSTKHFIDAHLTRTKTRQENDKEKQLAIVIKWKNLHIVNLPSENEEITEGLDFGEELVKIAGSSNGLVMLLKRVSKKIKMYVANPITRQQVYIRNPTPVNALEYGFGYDPSSDDYKVVTISHCDTNKYTCSLVHMYSLKLKTWKRVGKIQNCWCVNVMPFVGGAVHWLTRDYASDVEYGIQALDLATGTIHQVPLPDDEFIDEEGFQGLVVVNRCLGLVVTIEDVVDVWVMKEYGVVDSWVLLRFDVSMMGGEMKQVCSLVERESLYVSTDGMDCLLSYDPTMRRRMIDWGLCNASWSVFVESLVSPNQENVDAR